MGSVFSYFFLAVSLSDCVQPEQVPEKIVTHNPQIEESGYVICNKIKLN